MNTENWKWFRYDEIFEIRKGKRLTTADMEVGNIRYIGAIDSHNGVSNYISNDEHIHESNTITVSYNGSVGFAYFQDKPFWATDDVNVLYPKFPLNVNIALFLCTMIEKEQYRYNYGRKWTKDIMEKSIIKLPTTENGQPDWQWMENYAKNTLLPQLPLKARQVWEKRYNNQPLSAQKLELKVEEWKWFDYYGKNGLFDITGSTTTPKDILEESGNGIHPYVTTQAVNNGIEGYYNIATEEGSVFTVDSAVLGFCAYQEKDFSASDHVEKLIPKFSCNKYIALFLTTIINREQYRYNYGRKASQTKLRQSKIKLPAVTNENGETVPDWQWMEDYIKGLPYSGCLEQN